MNRWLQLTFFALVVRPVVWFVLGLNVRHRERLPKGGPAVLVANHNSHLDTLVLMTLFPLRMLGRLRPVAAEDYFLRTRFLRWFSQRIVGIIAIGREGRAGGHPLAPINEALQRGEIVILFPEGTRGEPEQIGEFKSGIALVARANADVPVYPIYLHGAGKALPRGEALLVPFFCDVFVGEPLCWTGDKDRFMAELTGRMSALAAEGEFPAWE
ncbi:MAG: 1-acyl-sn-glycerol-3-phosphate acyltransferase [Planctomycetes bacterium]|nr:1-acyl-sn-glycerol-3-phosphate acyltransferase [Planctomycetota bacterium]